MVPLSLRKGQISIQAPIPYEFFFLSYIVCLSSKYILLTTEVDEHWELHLLEEQPTCSISPYIRHEFDVLNQSSHHMIPKRLSIFDIERQRIKSFGVNQSLFFEIRPPFGSHWDSQRFGMRIQPIQIRTSVLSYPQTSLAPVNQTQEDEKPSWPGGVSIQESIPRP